MANQDSAGASDGVTETEASATNPSEAPADIIGASEAESKTESPSDASENSDNTAASIFAEPGERSAESSAAQIDVDLPADNSESPNAAVQASVCDEKQNKLEKSENIDAESSTLLTPNDENSSEANPANSADAPEEAKTQENKSEQEPKKRRTRVKRRDVPITIISEPGPNHQDEP